MEIALTNEFSHFSYTSLCHDVAVNNTNFYRCKNFAYWRTGVLISP